MKEIFKNFITVKSILTILLTSVFCYLAIKGSIPRELNDIYLMVISFYFGTQHEKINRVQK